MATRLSTSNNGKMILTSAAVIAVGLGAYGLGRVYPPLGPSAGTIAPAQRYVSSQLTSSDVTLGDTAVPQLMQTDAFELFVHDPSFRALASSPGFKAIAASPQSTILQRAHPGGTRRCLARAQSASGERGPDGPRRQPSWSDGIVCLTPRRAVGRHGQSVRVRGVREQFERLR